jgi:hypothetical protein
MHMNHVLLRTNWSSRLTNADVMIKENAIKEKKHDDSNCTIENIFRNAIFFYGSRVILQAFFDPMFRCLKSLIVYVYGKATAITLYFSTRTWYFYVIITIQIFIWNKLILEIKCILNVEFLEWNGNSISILISYK